MAFLVYKNRLVQVKVQSLKSNFCVKMLKFVALLVIATQFGGNDAAIVPSRSRRQTLEDCPRDEIEFHLYTPTNRIVSQIIKLDDNVSLINSNFNSDWPIRFVIHGWLNDQGSEIVQVIRDAYLEKGDFNVIAVDWSYCWSVWSFLNSAKNTKFAGEAIKEFAEFLHNSANVDYDNMYLIGHSLGAHVAGYAGRFLESGKFNTIFALDPAGPDFEGKPIECRVDDSDAKYVESIHTSSLYGYDEPVGKVSFYPNYGHLQNCLSICSHSEAYRYFAKSIIAPETFKGVKCENYEAIENENCNSDEIEYMGGEPSNPNREGIFYVPI